jgi:gamma-glutamylcyclotransferase (GGCT)/AIG2-like uncharacterized protein YtfP
MPKLFSYGTLQHTNVQVETFGRLLTGRADRIVGYRLSHVEITDPDVLAKSGKAVHPLAIPSNLPTDRVAGMVFDITDDELAQADAYEVDDYKRVEVTLESGGQAWLYIATDG